MLNTEEGKSTFAGFRRTVRSKTPTVSVPKALRRLAVDFFRRRQTSCRFSRWRIAGVAICLGLTLSSLGQVSRAADDQRARDTVDRVARQFIRQSSIATVEMQITKEDTQRVISMQYWSVGEANILVRIRKPQEDARTAILKVGNKAWIYLPKANRTMTLPPSMMATSWMGSDLTLNDLVNQTRLTKDYDVATSFDGRRDGVAVFEYTLTPKPAAAVVWGKIIMVIRQADSMPIWLRYYDEGGKPVREITFSEYRTVSGKLIPTRLVVRPLDHAGEQTTVTYQDIVFDVPISDEMFSLKSLKQ
jgi:outer membrane lipoprotein-sorting protein